MWKRDRDLPHLAAVIAAARDEFGGDDRGVCLAGISNGAWMARWYAAAHAEDVAALGAVAGLRPPHVQPARPVPVIAFHGLRDRTLPYEGGRGEIWRESVPEAARAWAVADGRDEEPVGLAVSPTLTRTSFGARCGCGVRAGRPHVARRPRRRTVLIQFFHGRIRSSSTPPRRSGASTGSVLLESKHGGSLRLSSSLTVGGRTYEIYRLDALQPRWDVARLPYTLRILLENVLRNGSEAEVEAVAGWVAADEPTREISFMPARVLLQDFTGVPAIVDLAAMRDAMRRPRRRPGEDQPAASRPSS